MTMINLPNLVVFFSCYIALAKYIFYRNDSDWYVQLRPTYW